MLWYGKPRYGYGMDYSSHDAPPISGLTPACSYTQADEGIVDTNHRSDTAHPLDWQQEITQTVQSQI